MVFRITHSRIGSIVDTSIDCSILLGVQQSQATIKGVPNIHLWSIYADVVE